VNGPTALAFLKWVVGPLALGILTCGLGNLRAREANDPWLQALEALPASERQALESATALSVANAVWAFGDEESVKKIAQRELDRLPESEGPSRARVFVRFGLVDSNPDGQAAVFHLACASDERVCNHVKEAAEREVQTRFVAPGNSLPLSLSGGHPKIVTSNQEGAP
jgi:hypothetical protein